MIPARTLPPKALVLALTPLLDERAVGALLDLRARGFDLAVVDVSPVPFAPPGRRPRRTRSPTGSGCIRRAALRYRFEQAGVPVVEWREDVPLAAALGGGGGIPTPRPLSRAASDRGRRARARAAALGVAATRVEAEPARTLPGGDRGARRARPARRGARRRLATGMLPGRSSSSAARTSSRSSCGPTRGRSTPAAPLVGAGLLVVAELAYWSLELRGPGCEERRLLARRGAALAGSRCSRSSSARWSSR